MEITDIKQQLTLATVLSHYNLKPDKHLQLCCPFHPDKTPSMKVYYKTHTAYCFSSNCPTHGKSLDVIDFVMHKEGVGKHEAIVKAKELIGGNGSEIKKLTRSVVLSKMMTYFKNGVHNSKPAQEYLQSRHLNHEQIEVGYNSGQFRHGARKEKTLIESCVKVGLLLDKGMIGRTGEKAYSPFGKGGIVFALKNKEGKVISMYFRSTTSNKSKHFYLKDRQGLYPGYPKSDTRKLILTEAIIDAATLLMQKELMKGYEVLSLFGTNGLTDEHRKAITDLKELEEVVIFFDGDDGGNKAAEKYKAILSAELPKTKISKVNTPEGEDINSLLDGHSPEILHQLIENRTPLFVGARQAINDELSVESLRNDQPGTDEKKTELDTSNPHDLRYKGQAANYSIKGFKSGGLDSLKVSLRIYKGTEDYRTRTELYEHKQVEGAAKKAAEIIGSDASSVEKDLSKLTTLLEAYRESHGAEERRHERKQIQVPKDTQGKCLELLKSKDYFQKLSEMIGTAGVIGEEKSRLLLYVIASTYKMSDTLHALVQGSSGSGKTHLISRISELMPEEDMIPLTRVTESSFYNYGEHELENKLLVMEDLDGLKEDAFLAFRELQSRGMLNSSTSVKDEQGNIRAALKRVYGPIASLSATTKGEVYEDNMSRCLIIAVDESEEQTGRIIEAQNQRAAGSIDSSREQKVIMFLQHTMRLIRPFEVINPYADKVRLPAEAQKIRRLNQLYQSFIKQITILHQFQRKRDEQGRLIAEKQDLRIAYRILFDSIVLKVDELDGSLRDFYEKLKAYANEKGGREYEFTRREVRQALKVSRTRQHTYMWQLQDLEYVYPIGGHANKGYHYRIAYWDSLEAMRAKIQDKLDQQLDQL